MTTPPPGGPTSNVDRLVAAARTYQQRTAGGKHVDVRPRLQVAVVACMDSRIDLFGLLGLEIGDVHMLRNAGGVVTDDVVRSLVLSQRLLGTREIVLIHHTNCGLQSVNEDELKDALQAETGLRPPWSVECFRDPFSDTRQSILRIRANPFVAHKGSVRGFVYDVDTHSLDEVLAEDG